MRLHIPIGIEKYIVALVFAVMLVTAITCPGEAEAATATFPYYNGYGGYSTTLFLVNNASTAVSAPISVLPLELAPHATFKFPNYPTSNDGGGVFDLNVPANVSAFVELTDPKGSSVRFSPISGFATASIAGLSTDKNQIAQVFVASSGFVRLAFYRDAALVSEYEPNMTNGVAIEVAPATANRVVVSPVNFSFGNSTPGLVYAFGFHRQTTGGYKIQNPVAGVAFP